MPRKSKKLHFRRNKTRTRTSSPTCNLNYPDFVFWGYNSQIAADVPRVNISILLLKFNQHLNIPRNRKRGNILFFMEHMFILICLKSVSLPVLVICCIYSPTSRFVLYNVCGDAVSPSAPRHVMLWCLMFDVPVDFVADDPRQHIHYHPQLGINL